MPLTRARCHGSGALALCYVLGLGALLEDGRSPSDMPMVIAAIVLLLVVGVGIELIVVRPVQRAVLATRGLTGAKR
ncbi:MAG: hypothetical protein ACRDQ1_03310 [Sciscionella sp.]